MDYDVALRLKALENEVYKLRDMIKNGKDSMFWDSSFIKAKD